MTRKNRTPSDRTHTEEPTMPRPTKAPDHAASSSQLLATSASLPTRYLWPEDVSVILGVPVETLYAWRKRNYGPRAAKVGRHLRYDPDEVSHWFAAQTTVEA
jgi:predicted DNA-binding transcriptional regulator AlpA